MTSHPLAYYHHRSVEPLRPSNPFLSFYRQANRLFEDIFREFDEAREALSGTFIPNINVTQSDHQTRITAELPGIREEDVEVSVRNDKLTIRAEKRVEHDEDKGNRQVKERSFGKFERVFRLSEPVEPDQIRAHFAHGLLTIILPGTDQEKSERKIAIDHSPAPANRPDPPPSGG